MLKLFLFFEEGPVGWKEVSLGKPSFISPDALRGPEQMQILWEPLGPNLQNGRTWMMLVVKPSFFFF